MPERVGCPASSTASLISASAAATAARMRARECGPTARSSPVKSMAPTATPEIGSRIGTAVQLRSCTAGAKCSAPAICTPRPEASAVPGALVPTAASDQSAPATKSMCSARRSVALSPRTQRSRPCSLVMATMSPVSLAGSTSRRSRTGRTC
ncbi:hypothetical protein ACFPRL_01835 [Pseudoclavibacter helvolus]